jgi:hypothetical protein
MKCLGFLPVALVFLGYVLSGYTRKVIEDGIVVLHMCQNFHGGHDLLSHCCRLLYGLVRESLACPHILDINFFNVFWSAHGQKL